MKRTLFYVVIAGLLCNSATSCKKEQQENPLYTIRQYGKYSFGAAISGKDYVLKWNDISRAVHAEDDTINGLGRCWSMIAWRDEGLLGSVENIDIFIKNFSGIGIYVLKGYKDNVTNIYATSATFSHYGYDYHADFLTNYKDTGFVECTKYDSVRKEFKFKFVCRDSISKGLREIEGYLSY